MKESDVGVAFTFPLLPPPPPPEPVTVSETGRVWLTPPELKVSAPLYVPAGRLEELTLTEMLVGEVPEPGLAESQVWLLVTVKVVLEVEVSESVCAKGLLPTGVLKVMLVGLKMSGPLLPPPPIPLSMTRTTGTVSDP